MTATTSTTILAWKPDLSHHLNNHARWVNVAERFHAVASSASWLRVATLRSSRHAIFTRFEDHTGLELINISLCLFGPYKKLKDVSLFMEALFLFLLLVMLLLETNIYILEFR